MKSLFIAYALVSAHHLQENGIHVGDSEFGVGTVTCSEQQNLEFLDIPLTAGIRYMDMVAQLEPGGDYEGWRIATIEEVKTLINLAHFTPPWDGIAQIHWSTVDISELVELLGHTNSQESQWLLRGFTSDADPVTNNPGRIFIVDRDPAGTFDPDDPYTDDGVPNDFVELWFDLQRNVSSGQTGFFLVREMEHDDHPAEPKTYTVNLQIKGSTGTVLYTIEGTIDEG